MNEFLEAMKKLIEERFKIDVYVMYDRTLELKSHIITESVSLEFTIFERHFILAEDKIRQGVYWWDFDITNPKFDPEDIIKWIITTGTNWDYS